MQCPRISLICRKIELQLTTRRKSAISSSASFKEENLGRPWMELLSQNTSLFKPGLK
jgi:hypothetical protein